LGLAVGLTISFKIGTALGAGKYYEAKQAAQIGIFIGLICGIIIFCIM